jgi:hypothetical protein
MKHLFVAGATLPRAGAVRSQYSFAHEGDKVSAHLDCCGRKPAGLAVCCRFGPIDEVDWAYGLGDDLKGLCDRWFPAGNKGTEGLTGDSGPWLKDACELPPTRLMRDMSVLRRRLSDDNDSLSSSRSSWDLYPPLSPPRAVAARASSSVVVLSWV